jgi:diamine N-acetyltransferase
MIVVKKVGVEAIDTIQLLAYQIWPVTYHNIISAAQMEYMLDKMYSAATLQHQIDHLGHQFLLILQEDTAIAFASYSMKSMETPSLFRLHKIYISPEAQGKGIGKKILNYLIQDIQPKGAQTLELNVNRHNPAFHFYTKIGFVIFKEEKIAIGNDFYMDDYVLQMPL